MSSKPYIYGIDYTLDEQNDSERRLFLQDSLVKPQGLVVCLSAEPADYHTVTHVSANCYQYIGYRPTEMVETDWTNYLPRPIRQKHKQLFNPQFNRSLFFSIKKGYELSMVHKDGYLREGLLMARLNYTIEKGIQVFSHTLISQAASSPIKVYLDQDNKILEVNSKGISMFSKDQPFKKYNSYLNSILSNFFRICSQKQTKKTFTITDMTALNLDVSKLTAYTQLLVGSSFTIRLDSGEKVRMKVKAQRFQLFPSIDPATLVFMEPDLNDNFIQKRLKMSHISKLISEQQEFKNLLLDDNLNNLDEFDRQVVEYITTFKNMENR